MLLCQVNEWQAGAAAGHSQCQAAKPAALGQPGPAGLGALPASAPHSGGWGPGLQGDRGLCGERGVIGGRGRGGASGRVSVRLSEAYSYLTLLSPPPPPLVFQTVSINKAINTQVVAVKEKHARNILLEVAPKTDPKGNELMGTEVRARRPCSAAGTGTPSSQAPAGSEHWAGGSWLQSPQPVGRKGPEQPPSAVPPSPLT